MLQNVGLKATSSFMIVGAKDLAPRSTITLKGTFGFDALSPDGSRLYLIQHTSVNDIQHYIVRVYDLKTHKLLPGRVADKSQQSWVMQGFAVDRVTTADGRWAYTLYSNPGGYPFVHALDTVRGVAHCIGVPWRGSENEPWNMRLALRNDGKSLAVNQQTGATFVAIDTATWKISYPNGSGSYGRRVREELDQKLADPIRLTEREVVIRVDLHESRAGHRARDSTVDLLQAGRVERRKRRRGSARRSPRDARVTPVAAPALRRLERRVRRVWHATARAACRRRRAAPTPRSRSPSRCRGRRTRRPPHTLPPAPPCTRRSAAR